MCRAVTCRECGNTTWAGCGRHIAQVQGMIAAEQWRGHPDGGASSEAAARRPGVLARLLRRR